MYIETNKGIKIMGKAPYVYLVESENDTPLVFASIKALLSYQELWAAGSFDNDGEKIDAQAAAKSIRKHNRIYLFDADGEPSVSIKKMRPWGVKRGGYSR